MLCTYHKNIAYPYAKAAYQFSKSNNCIQEWNNMFILVTKTLKIPIFNSLCHGILGITYPKTIFNQIFEKYIDCFFKNFIYIIIENKRLFLIESIFFIFKNLCEKFNNIQNIQIIVPNKLSEIEYKNIISQLERKFSSKINLTHNVNKNIIGGIIIKKEKLQIDKSIKNYLNQIKKYLKTN
ncbi:ATP synthase subunit delta [Buchnera aphidicola (Thelaxes suberi)]